MMGKHYCGSCSSWVDEAKIRQYLQRRNAAGSALNNRHRIWRCDSCQARRLAHQAKRESEQ